MDELQTLKHCFSGRNPKRIEAELYGEAAVLIPLIKEKGELKVLFEIRSDKLQTQPGEVCFPGGTVEKEQGERPEEAAVRETSEELRVEKSRIEVIAPLDYLWVPGGVTVYPYLGTIRDYGGSWSEEEVRQIRLVPLSWFLEREPDRYHTKVITVPDEGFPYDFIPDGKDYKWRQGRYDVLFYRYEDLTIWGMTAKIMYSFILAYRQDTSESPE